MWQVSGDSGLLHNKPLAPEACHIYVLPVTYMCYVFELTLHVQHVAFESS